MPHLRHFAPDRLKSTRKALKKKGNVRFFGSAAKQDFHTDIHPRWGVVTQNRGGHGRVIGAHLGHRRKNRPVFFRNMGPSAALRKKSGQPPPPMAI
jgi:hypothetical protein